jgi:hypothetical protein
MTGDFQQLFSVPPITGVTINDVMLAPDVRVLVYSLAGVVLVIVAAFSLLNGSRPSVAGRRALLAAFFSAGILYAVLADYVWSGWITADMRSFGGLKTEEKLGRLEGRFSDFTLAAKKVIEGDYLLFSSDSYLSLRAEYFLLPLRKRAEANYIIVLADQEAQYDQTSRTFTRGGLRIGSVDPVLVFARNAYILKRNPS